MGQLNKILFFYIIINLISSCNSTEVKINYDFKVIFTPNIDKNSYKVKFKFRGPLNLNFDESVLNFYFYQKETIFSQNSDKIKSIMFLENGEGEIRCFYEVPSTYYIDSFYDDTETKRVIDINLKENEEKTIDIKTNFYINYFEFKKNILPRKVRFLYFDKRFNKIIYSNWIFIEKLL